MTKIALSFIIKKINAGGISVSKTKSIIIIVILAIVIVGMMLMIFPLNGEDSFAIGNTNYDFKWVSKAIKLGLDLEGGMYAVYEADLSEFGSQEEADAAMQGTMANLESLLFSKGYTEATVTKQGNDQIRVEVPSVEDTESLMALLGDPAELEFRDESGNVLIEGSKHLESATATLYEGSYAISLQFNDEGTAEFATATTNNIGKKISIFINDQEVMAPTVNTAITDGKAIITGQYDYKTANEYAIKINAGTFAVKLSPIQTSTISPTLGENALKYGIMAGLIGLAVVMLIMIIRYRGLGIASAFALVIYTVLLIYALAIVPWVQLTLPSIAGVILSIGMAVDANVIIFERIRDERRFMGKAIPSAVNTGFKKAIIAIIDSNVTTILGSIVMIIFGATAIKSFAITLLIGVLLSMFTAIFITRLLVKIELSFNDTNDLFYALKVEEGVEEEKGGKL